MIDQEQLQALRSSLDADGYRLDVRSEGARTRVEISATPDACADCLVPKDLMRGILQQALGVAVDSIDLSYPGELDSWSPEPE